MEALVVTKLVLIILATVSISAVVGDNGIIAKAKLAKNIQANSIEAEQDAMNELLKEYENAMPGEGSVGDTANEIETPEEPDNPEEPQEPTEPEDTTVAVESVNLDKTSERIGNKTTLLATVEPSNASNKSIQWSSSNENVLKVDENGIVTRISDTARETITITASAQDGSNKTATCIVEVYPLVTTATDTSHETITTVDKLGNFVEVPGGFKIASDSSDNVKEGIVVEDSDENQFVWIPVSNINHDGSNLIKIENEDETTSEVEITLGRYIFDTTTGKVSITEGKYQYALNYTSTVTLDSYFQELTTFRESTQSSGIDGTNATAKDLAGFIESVEENHGYYLARYEASYSSGNAFGVGNDETYYKPASKVSTANSTSSMSYTAGTLWNFITQGNASKACRQMYYGNEFVESDLVNSYAWDTAIVYIQAMGNTNYANQKDGNGTLKNTGSTGDEKCKIFDMASNCWEWTTEYSTYTDSNDAYHCTLRGGCCHASNFYTSLRASTGATGSYESRSFRVALYVKN